MNARTGPSLSSRSRLKTFAARFRPGSSSALLAASLVGGLGLSACFVTLVRAADGFGVFELFNSPTLERVAGPFRVQRPRPAPPLALKSARPSADRVVFRPDVRKRVERRARVAFATATARVSTRMTMCVRTCDGFAFPLGRFGGRGDAAAHQSACSAACPGAETKLYTMAPGQRSDDLAGARSVADGSLYRRLRTAFLYQKNYVAACSCQGPDNIATRLPILMDPTLRSGDVVIDKGGGAKVYAGSGQIPHAPKSFADFRRSPALGQTARAQVDRLIGTSQKEATARAFESTLRVRRASLETTPLREIRAPAGSAANIRVYQVSNNAGTLDQSGARIILIR